MSSEDQQALRLRLVYLMRRFLFLALGMGMLLPTAANAKDWFRELWNSYDYKNERHENLLYCTK